MRKILSLLLVLTGSCMAIAQSTEPIAVSDDQYVPQEYKYWVDMMNDPSVNFYDVQQEFNRYFEGKPTGKGTGWKQFKRWEWFTEQRVYPSGSREIDVNVMEEVMEFRKNYPANNNTREEWTELGPFTWLNNTGHWNPGLGRINVIKRDPANPEILYIGAPNAGLWKTIDEGQTWTPLTDELPLNSVSAIAINPENTDIIYIGTGDRDMHASYPTYSMGVLKSEDGGETWAETGLSWTIYQNRVVARLLINPDDPDILFAATSDGMYKTIDAGINWYKVQSGNFDDTAYKPGDPNTVYGSTTQFFRSDDGGETFTQISGPPSGSRVQIAVTEANPDYVYFYSANSGLYRSEDSGETFTFRGSTPNPGYQAWYDMAIAVSHIDEEEVHIGEINTFRSFNGGTSWTQTTDWTWENPIGYTHCDIHEMVFYGGILYVGSDGLISKSTDNGATWDNISIGLNIRQFYRIGTSQSSPYMILGGSQDNGTSVYSYDYWHEWLGADGMECVVDHSNDNIVYGTSQNGSFYKSDEGGNFGNVDIQQPGGGNWITPFVIHPTDPQTLFVGSSSVRKTTNGMLSWTTISSFGGGNLNAIAIGNSDPDYLYASRQSTIHRTKDGGANWDNVSAGLPGLYISYITVNPNNPEMVAVSLSGFQDGKKVFISHNAGDTWTNISANLPNLPANCIVFNDDVYNGLYVGMDDGVYFINDETEEWESFMNGLPNVVVAELEINYEEHLIRAGTYGRGLWEAQLQVIAPLAIFEADKTSLPVGCEVNFTSLSIGPPDSYEWYFEGGTPETSTEKDPAGIAYEIEGVYDVSLTVTNDLGSNTELKEDYITVSSTILPATDFTSNRTIICSGESVEFTDLTEICPVAWLWEITPNTVSFIGGTNENSQNPIVLFEENGQYTIALTASNANGDFTMTKEDYISIGGQVLPFFEDFESGSLDASSWTIVNPDNLVTWAVTEIGGTSPGNQAAFMDIFNYAAPPGRRDQLISPPINLTGYDEVHLLFEHAYATKYASISDSLILFISTDCGVTWTRIFSGGDDGEGSFATHELTAEEFIPQIESDWCGAGYGSECYTIDISEWAGMPNVKIMFESYHYLGNNLYVDNVLITPSVGVNQDLTVNDEIRVYPNPSNGLINIWVQNMSRLQNIKVLNMQGKVIINREINASANSDDLYEVDLTNYPKGIYFIQVNGKDFSSARKVILE